MAIERQLDCSLYGLMYEFLITGTLRYVTLDFITAVLRYALPEPVSQEDAEKIIEDHWAAGGTLNDVVQATMNTLVATGFFMPGGKATAKEPPKTATEKK